MAGTVASPLLDVVCDRLDSHATALCKSTCFRNTRLKLSELQALLQDIESSGSDSNLSLRNWLSVLRDLAYDIDGIIDNWELSIGSCCFPSFAYTSKIDKDLKAVDKRLDFLLESFYKFVSGGFLSYNESVDNTLNIMDDEDVIFGRDFDLSDIVNTLYKNSNENSLHFIPIVGMGGIGKTLLAKRIYNDDKVKNHFHFRVWVSVCGNLDIATIAGAIAVENRTLRVRDETLFEPREVLRGIRFLIVLDNVWDDDGRNFEKLRAWLNVGHLGSCVLVTTRSSRVAALMGTVPVKHLTYLSDEESWALFRHLAFRSMGEYSAELENIGRNIVAKCKGLPLAVKSIGGLLRSKSIQEWLSIMGDDLWKLPEFKSHLLPVLKPSYDRLPSCLKQCFVYCLIFPKGYWINREKLVQLWIAEGFIRLKAGSEVLEDIADDYFMELLQQSFFHDLVRDDVGEVVAFRMHDFMHDLAQFVAEVECSIMSIGYSQGAHGYVRYSSLVSDFTQLTTSKSKKLRTLLLLSGKLENVSSLFQMYSLLRVLDLSHCGMIELPASIDTLKHLRYLNLSQTYIRRIPESISKLKQLQMLELSNCYNLEEIPKAICLLTNLRNIGIGSCCSLIHLPSGIGKLRLLRKLSAFILSKRRDCATLRELNMLDLGGKLIIKNLENVKILLDAREAKLHEKINIHSLELSWSFNAHMRGDISAQVVDILRPPQNLKFLCLRGYRGFMYPSWMNSGLPNLVKVCLINCNCLELPPLGQLANLKDLYVRRMSAVHIIGHEFYGNGSVRGFPCLQQLELHDMPNLLEWKSLTMAEIDGLTGIQEPFPCLEKLIVDGCHSLTFLPFIPNLKNLALRDSNVRLLHSLSRLRLLPSLVIDNFQDLNYFPGYYGNVNSIVKLTLHDCDNLKTVFEVAHIFPYVRHLSILNCDKLSSLAMRLRESKFLRKLDIVECPRLCDILDMQHLYSLVELTIVGCPFLTLSSKSIRFLRRLHSLVIKRCPGLERQLKREAGMDWFKILPVQNIETEIVEFTTDEDIFGD
ncbi:hypothetical protein Dsin_018323 [Dipteronia sinensis]|uniref:Uncharacterized protein n=1 Tax=Dipteronia sinensis TaxID=43782 RepID=A0AAE0A5P9_9ROSI|nr:hypothetical protein Dsin_018323 [Dipteronia sinensis]